MGDIHVSFAAKPMWASLWYILNTFQMFSCSGFVLPLFLEYIHELNTVLLFP